MTRKKSILQIAVITLLCFLPLSSCSSLNSSLSSRQQVLQESGSLIPGSVHTISMPIGNIRTAFVSVFTDNKDLLTEIFDHEEQLVESVWAADQPQVFTSDIEDAFFTLIEIDNPKDGIWHIEINSKQEANYEVRVDAETSTILEVHTDRMSYSTGTPIFVTAQLLQGKVEIIGGEMWGQLLNGTDKFQELVLQETESGIFEGQFEPAIGDVRPSLLITASNATIQRQVIIPLVVYEQSAQILSVIEERLESGDTEGINNLILDVQVSVERSGRFTLAAHLESMNGDEIAYAEFNSAILGALGDGNEELHPGLHIISLTFSGEDVRDSGLEGPFNVRIVLYDTDQDGVEVDALETPYQTLPYSGDEFD